METLLLELGMIVGIATLIGVLGRVIKQPPIIAYLATGILAGPIFLDIINSTEQLKSLAHLGVALLLFMVGINLDFRILKQIGGASVVGGISTMAIISATTFILARSLSFQNTSALYLALAFSFSSTVVVVKILSDKKEIDTLHGQIALGILIIEDFMAALALMIIPVLGEGSFATISIQVVKAVALIGFIFFVGRKIVPKIFDIAAKNQELLFLCSVSWALLVGLIFSLNGLSIEIGALLAGMAIASSSYSLEIKSKVKGIRDFFVVLFFAYFGAQLSGPINLDMIKQAVIFSLLILIGKPLVVMSLMNSFGFKKRTNFMTGTSLTQVSEFSLIVILLGVSTGHLPQSILTLSILVTFITVFLSSYSIYFAQPIYEKISNALGLFDGHKKEIENNKKDKSYDVVLLGYNRIGFNLLKAFNLSKKKYLIVDYNPITILNLTKKGMPCIYGDINDSEFLKSLNLNRVKMVISTIPDYSTNSFVKKNILNDNCVFVPTAHDIQNALDLYREGADYVIMPHFLGGEFMANMLVRDEFNKESLKNEGKRHIRELHERTEEGHQHPRKDFHGV